MKTILRASDVMLLLGLLFFSTTSFAGEEPKVEKKKTYNKSVNVDGSDRVSITNQFGEVKLNTWDRNEVKVDVTITAKANTEERAQEILDRIEIEDGKNSSGVYFKTEMENESRSNRNGDKYKNEGFSIDYSVSLPSRNALIINNSFGSTIIPNYAGEVDITSKFGSLQTGNLANVKIVTVEFGSANIEGINDGKLIVKFSRAIVNKLSGNVNATFEHSSGVKLGLDNNIKGLTVKNNFTTLYLDVNKNLSADFDIRTHFGELSNRSDFAIRREDEGEEHGPKFDYRYTGKSGNGSIAMKIRSEFGQVIVGHNLSMDLKEDKKENKRTTSI